MDSELSNIVWIKLLQVFNFNWY